MINHPYPDHVRDAVADAIESLFMEADTWEKIDAAHDNLADTALQALWDASRIDTVEQVDELPNDAVLIDRNRVVADDYVTHCIIDLPAHVIHWGDTDE